MNYAAYFGLSFAGSFMSIILFCIIIFWIEQTLVDDKEEK